ncbi:sigma-54-dependent Fis family transcriptional regulator [Archangium sp. Cb G35]|uniref:sigma-54-dependent transcriptional regulator n=1 Tax=Archangium sp. Cb G35 TaxID=1920190 RepID=UPI0009365526|nr:sigma-54 dependent transcriptional regulator [Archangium sp. Cb G35]OJT18706.1 sigma-54-dependent Fis family transcriptional regulator [Archangium sp. Cb G35]
MAQVLVVDDEVKLGKLVAEALELDGHEVARVAGGRAALVELARRGFDVVLTDLMMPEVGGLEVLKAAQALPTPPAVVMMTAYGTAENAVAAMKGGAADYLTKPFAMDEVRLRVRRLAEQRAAETRSERLVRRLTPELVAESPRMKQVLASAKQVAASDASVVLLGESGTGKSQLARLIHYSSKRAAGPLVEVHCAALPETLLEGELFGHEKGAFTGATERKVGHLAAADGGTLFLDEIGEVTPATQVKLLRFLQEREFVPLGSTQARKVDVRVIAATNRDLAAAVREGRFREDFYYRLNVFSIEVPPLRERKEDLVSLAHAVLARKGLPTEKLSKDAEARLLGYTWPGNVRELENAMERALILSGEGDIQAEHLGAGGPSLSRGGGKGVRAADVLGEGFNLDTFERELLYAALERAGGNKTAAAKLLGITRRRLYSRLQSLGEKVTDPESD